MGGNELEAPASDGLLVAGLGTISPRHAAWGARTAWYRSNGVRGAGTRAARRWSSSSGGAVSARGLPVVAGAVRRPWVVTALVLAFAAAPALQAASLAGLRLLPLKTQDPRQPRPYSGMDCMIM